MSRSLYLTSFLGDTRNSDATLSSLVAVAHDDEQAAVVAVHGMAAVASLDGYRIIVHVYHICGRRRRNRFCDGLFDGGGVLRDADVLSFVEQEELVVFDDLDQLLGVLRVGGVTGLLQSVGPAFIIRGVEFEQVLIPGRFVQELGMIPVRFLDRRVFAETFVRGVVGMRDGLPRPVAFALDAEMVVGLAARRLLPLSDSNSAWASLMLAGMP